MSNIKMKRRSSDESSSQEAEPRKRAPQALIVRVCRCLPCRKKKMRCDGKKPKCSHCAKLGLECGYNQNRKPGLQPGYVAHLQNRIAELEALVEEQNEALQRAGVHRRLSVGSIDDRCLPVNHRASNYLTNPTADRRPSMYANTLTLPLPVPSALHTARRFSQQSLASNNLEGQKSSGLDHLLHAAMSTTSNKETPKDPLSRRGSVASVSFPAFPHDIFHSTEEENSTKTPSPTKPTASPDPTLIRKSSWVTCQGLPPREILTVLMDLYFEYVHPTFPVLEKEKIFAIFSNKIPSSQDDLCILRAITSCVAPFVIHSSLKEHADEIRSSFGVNPVFHQPIFERALDSPSLTSLQALAILSSSYLNSNLNVRLVGAVGMLSSLATLSSPSMSDSQLNDVDRSEWCRLHLAILLLKCSINITSDTFAEDAPLSPLISSSSLGNSDLWSLCVESAHYFMRILAWIQGAGEHENPRDWRNDGENMARCLDGWWHKIPVHLKFLEGDSNVPCRILLKCIRASSSMMLHDALASLHTNGPASISQSKGIALQAAFDLAGISRHLISSNLIPYTHPLVPFCFFSALRHLFSYSQETRSDTMDLAISDLKAGLNAMNSISLAGILGCVLG